MSYRPGVDGRGCFFLASVISTASTAASGWNRAGTLAPLRQSLMRWLETRTGEPLLVRRLHDTADAATRCNGGLPAC
ncbi:hypothetical protein Scel_05630 [Streptomyces cellostaticus]|nr:hypothetical protein Scel_05630 [Streptomyces cellostaticus]